MKKKEDSRTRRRRTSWEPTSTGKDKSRCDPGTNCGGIILRYTHNSAVWSRNNIPEPTYLVCDEKMLWLPICWSVSGGTYMMTTATEKDTAHTVQTESAIKTHKKPGRVSAILYRLPLPVTKVLVFSCGYSYPICPRCDCTVDREYMRYCDRCGQHLSWEVFDHAKVIQAPRNLK